MLLQYLGAEAPSLPYEKVPAEARREFSFQPLNGHLMLLSFSEFEWVFGGYTGQSGMGEGVGGGGGGGGSRSKPWPTIHGAHIFALK